MTPELSHLSNTLAWQLKLPDYFAFSTSWLLQEGEPCLVHAELRESGSKPFLHEGVVLHEGIIAAQTQSPHTAASAQSLGTQSGG